MFVFANRNSPNCSWICFVLGLVAFILALCALVDLSREKWVIRFAINCYLKRQQHLRDTHCWMLEHIAVCMFCFVYMFGLVIPDALPPPFLSPNLCWWRGRRESEIQMKGYLKWRDTHGMCEHKDHECDQVPICPRPSTSWSIFVTQAFCMLSVWVLYAQLVASKNKLLGKNCFRNFTIHLQEFVQKVLKKK